MGTGTVKISVYAHGRICRFEQRGLSWGLGTAISPEESHKVSSASLVRKKKNPENLRGIDYGTRM